MAISRDKDDAYSDGAAVGKLISEPDVTFRPTEGMLYDHCTLAELSKLIQPMTEPRITRDWQETPRRGQKASKREVSRIGGNLFRNDRGAGVSGTIADGDPIGSIEPGALFKPAPGVTFTYDELLQISEFVKRTAEVRP